MSSPPTCTLPVTFPVGLVSCMRFRQRTNVDLPQPEGPISAVTWFAGICRFTSFSVWTGPYHAFRSWTSMPTPTHCLHLRNRHNVIANRLLPSYSENWRPLLCASDRQ